MHTFFMALFEHSQLCCLIFLWLGDLPGPSDLDVWTELCDEVKTKLSKSAVSLAFCNGDYAAILFVFHKNI